MLTLVPPGPPAGFSVVKLVTHRTTGEKYACKVMSLPAPGAAASANDNTREDIFKEIDILIGLEHDNVIFLKGGTAG